MIDRRGLLSPMQTMSRETAAIVPSPNTPQGGRRRYVLSDSLARIDLSAELTSSDVTARFYVENPSTRLALKVAILFKPDGNGVPFTPIPQSGAGGVYLSLQAYDRDADGLVLPSNQIITTVPCPTSYEATTMNDRWMGTVTFPDIAGQTDLDVGSFRVVAAWEPAAGWNGDDSQLAKIFDACRLVVEHGLQLYTS